RPGDSRAPHATQCASTRPGRRARTCSTWVESPRVRACGSTAGNWHPVRPPVPRGDGTTAAVRQRVGDRRDEPLGEPDPRFGCAARAVEGVRGYQLRRHRLQTVRRIRLAAQAVRSVRSRAPRAARVPRPMKILAAFLILASQGPRNLLTGSLSEQTLAAALLPAAQWHPYPTIRDRADWEAVPQEIRAAFIQAARQHVGTTWE